ncbi:Pyoverdine/dityrosine biosynthesis protein-domain-containing protein [Jackrogersella minutella]|nr:Pyoverdine/dityrosine biosynthesis protein-domain-containing protein [Jackrogersella minutella]
MPSALTLDTADDLASTTVLPAKPGKLEPSYLETASHILSIISRYKLARDVLLSKTNGGVNFLSQIYGRVSANEVILMCLPAFPFKSPNTSTKVLGRLPDKAEEFALAHLNGLCAAIEDIYAPGAKLMIVSDGLVYNDLLGVPDKDVWAYGEALRALRARKDFRHIEFCRLKDIVHIDVPNELDEIRYVANATNFRHALLKQFGKPEYNVSLRISEDEDTCLTYRGYIKFLETDLQNVYPIGEGRSKSKYKRGVEYIAKQMLMRGDAFARGVRERFTDRLRLSIHASTGENKLSVNLLPTDTMFTTPWHCTIAFRLDGTTTTGHRSEFEGNDDFELVYEDSRPSYFREKSDLLSWAVERGGITCEPLYPAGIIITPAIRRGALSIRDIDAVKVRRLSQVNSPVVLRGFSKTRDRDLFVAKAGELGVPTSSKFATTHEVHIRDEDTQNSNKVLEAEHIILQYYERFQAEAGVREDGSEEFTSTLPLCHFFAAVAEPPKNAGFALFSSSTLLLKYLPKHLPLSSLRPRTWTASAISYNSTGLGCLPLVINHPATNRACLRFLEPQSKTRFDTTHVTIDNSSTPGVKSTTVCDALTSLFQDRRVVYYHTWEKGDLLMNDNLLTVYAKRDFTAGYDQELWRIRLD